MAAPSSNGRHGSDTASPSNVRVTLKRLGFTLSRDGDRRRAAPDASAAARRRWKPPRGCDRRRRGFARRGRAVSASWLRLIWPSAPGRAFSVTAMVIDVSQNPDAWRFGPPYPALKAGRAAARPTLPRRHG